MLIYKLVATMYIWYNSEKALKQKRKAKKHLNKKLPVVLVFKRASPTPKCAV